MKSDMGSESLNTNGSCCPKDKNVVIDGGRCKKREGEKNNMQCGNGGRPPVVFANRSAENITQCIQPTGESSKMDSDACDFSASPIVVSHDSQQQKRRYGDNTLEDLISLYGEDQLEEDDDEDSDWEPHSQSIVGEKWFCINCTMPSFDGVHCDVCGEFKESKVVNQGFFASPTTREGFPLLQRQLLNNAKVEQRPHHHPERPDRLRAIAASVLTSFWFSVQPYMSLSANNQAHTCIFPGRCAAIPAREITREELGLIHSLEHANTIEATGYMLSRKKKV